MAHVAAVMSARSVVNVFPSKYNKLLMFTGDCFVYKLAPIQGFGPSHFTLSCVLEGSAGERLRNSGGKEQLSVSGNC